MTPNKDKPLTEFIIEQGDPAKGDYRFNITIYTQCHSNVGVVLGIEAEHDQNWENFDNGRTFTLRTDVLPNEKQMETIIQQMSIVGQMMSDEIMTQIIQDRTKIHDQLIAEKILRQNAREDAQKEGDTETPTTPQGTPTEGQEGAPQGQPQGGGGPYRKMSEKEGTATEGQLKWIHDVNAQGGNKAAVIDAFLKENDFRSIGRLSKHHASMLLNNIK